MQRDAHIYCENGYPDAYIHVNIGIECLFLRENRHPGCVYFGMPNFHLTPEPWTHSGGPHHSHDSRVPLAILLLKKKKHQNEAEYIIIKY